MEEEMQPIDWLQIKKAIADIEERFRKDQREYEKHAASDDKGLKVHAAYWRTLASRHGAMADYVHSIWTQIP